MIAASMLPVLIILRARSHVIHMDVMAVTVSLSVCQSEALSRCNCAACARASTEALPAVTLCQRGLLTLSLSVSISFFYQQQHSAQQTLIRKKKMI